jgi:Ca2+-binding EF-hand superfamily protein
MGSKHSIFFNRKNLKEIPFTRPSETDYNFLSYQTGLPKEEIINILNNHLDFHPDGKMNRMEFCDLFLRLRNGSPEIVQGLSENIFRCLNATNPDDDSITLNEFFIVYALTSRGDLRKKLEYSFSLYDANNDNAIELSEVKEIIEGMLELLNQPQKPFNVDDVTKNCLKHMKVTEVVQKNDFINGLLQNKDVFHMMNVLNTSNNI